MWRLWLLRVNYSLVPSRFLVYVRQFISCLVSTIRILRSPLTIYWNGVWCFANIRFCLLQSLLISRSLSFKCSITDLRILKCHHRWLYKVQTRKQNIQLHLSIWVFKSDSYLNQFVYPTKAPPFNLDSNWDSDQGVIWAVLKQWHSKL